MGNEGSKPKGSSNFQRSDTMNSTKSSRSIRSKKSTSQSKDMEKDKGKAGEKERPVSEPDKGAKSHAPTHHHTHSLSKASSILSRRSSFKSNFSNENELSRKNDPKDDHYDYIYDTEFDHETVPIDAEQHQNHINTENDVTMKLPPSMVILKPKPPILRINSSTSINDNSIQHMSTIDRQHSNTDNNFSNMSRRNSTTTVNSRDSKTSRASRTSRSSRSSRNSRSETHGIPIDAFDDLNIHDNNNGTSNTNIVYDNNSHADSPSIDNDHFLNPIQNSPLRSQQFLTNPNSPIGSSHSKSNPRSRSSTLSNRIKTPFSKEDSADYLRHNENENDQTVYDSNFTDGSTSYNNNTSNNGNHNGELVDTNTNKHDPTIDGPSTNNTHPHKKPDINTENVIDSDKHAEIHNVIDNTNGINANSNENYPNAYDYRRRYDLNIEDLIQRLLDAGYSGKRTKSVCLKNSEIAMICSVAREIFLSQPSLLELSAPVKIVGDVHGQYIDLIRIFSKCGFPPASNYLFLGDYVDRGKQSLETILLLLCYKIKFPENFFLLRGNHECAQITRQYGFYDECKRRTNLKTWKLFVDTFNTLPIAAIVASKIFCVHGGLSPVLNSMDEIRNIRRPTDVPDFGLLNDLLWSDPADSPNQWEDNERGVSYCFNKVAINNFLNKFQFDLVVRAHMVVEDGYEFFNDRSLVTVFSAPNYCGEFDNWGAVMGVSEELLCSFELLDPLDSVALKSLMKKGRIERRNAMLSYNSNSAS